MVASIANKVMMTMSGQGITDKKIIGFVSAALATVGKAKHGKGYAPVGVEFKNWGANPGETCTLGGEGLNCWTALIWWAFTGGAIDQSTVNNYSQELQGVAGDMEAENHIMYSFLRANQVTTIDSSAKPPIGRTIFFGDPSWKRPTNHVVVSIGDGLVVSQASLFMGVAMSAVNKIAGLNPSIPFEELVSGLTHISRIDYIAEGAGGGDSIRMTTRPFWELPRTKWVG